MSVIHVKRPSSPTRLFFLPALALGAAAWLFSASRPAGAFSILGGSLDENQRDVRVFDNFADLSANDNTTPASQFPGFTGCELAVWKGIVEWGSDLHGDGSGDPTQPVLGDGNANFDAFWCGNATGIGGINDNIVSASSTCGAGILAFVETPASDGWRIRFCEDFTWDDGPGEVAPFFDIQGVMVHEYGHALGLGHSTVAGATMGPTTIDGVDARSIEADDVAGIQFVYGAEAPAKPDISATVADSQAGTLTIHGTDFDPSSNDVWLTHATASAPSDEPRVLVLGVASAGGTSITVPIPAAAGPGDVIVKKAGTGHDTVSNAFPTDLVGTFDFSPLAVKRARHAPPLGGADVQVPARAFALSAVVPATIDALIPGTEQTVTLRGAGLDRVTSITLGDETIDPERYTIVDATTITLDMPLAASLGTQTISVSDGVDVVPFEVTIAAPSAPRLELGSGDALNVVDVDDGLPLVIAGEAGKKHYVFVSSDDTPSTNAFVDLALGNRFTTLGLAGVFTIPERGWIELTVPIGALLAPAVGGTVLYSQSVALDPPRPWPASNLQSVLLVR